MKPAAAASADPGADLPPTIRAHILTEPASLMKSLGAIVAVLALGYIALHVSPAGRRALTRMRQEERTRQEEAAAAAQKSEADAAAQQQPEPPKKSEAQRIVETSDKQMVLVFWQPNCPACERMEPMVEMLERQASLQVLRVNTRLAENWKLSNDFRIRVTPTFVLVQKGLPLRRHEADFRTFAEMLSFAEHPGL
jgi:thiol-disulfide isomerase/thioredoxin